MPAIDTHAHVVPAELTRAAPGNQWHGFTVTQDASGHKFLEQGNRRILLHPGYLWTPEQRLSHMDAIGVDVHILSPWSQFHNYRMTPQAGIAMSRTCNDHIAEMTRAYPSRFIGLCTLPMQDVSAAIVELERGMIQLGMRGCVINDHVNGRTYDAPEFVPFWQAAEQLGALVMFHHSEGDTIVDSRSNQYHVGNSIGSLSDRTITFASLVFSGVLDRYPKLKLYLCHGGGYSCFGAGRMDRGWQVRKEAREHLNQPPSFYLQRFYYDCITHSDTALRLIIDTVGADRIFLGSDWPYDMGLESPAQWIMEMQSLSPEEKEAILWKNIESLLE